MVSEMTKTLHGLAQLKENTDLQFRGISDYTKDIVFWKWLIWERLYFSINSESSFTFILSMKKGFIKINLIV